MEALKRGSLFSDYLQNQWRHQLEHYQIVTFYEGIGDVGAISMGYLQCRSVIRRTDTNQVVPRDSACLGLGGDHEAQLKIEAKHGDMCKFNPNVTTDENNYEVVEGNMIELCEKAAKQLGERSHSVMTNLSKAPSLLPPTTLSIMPSKPRDALASSHPQDDNDLARHLKQLRG